MRPRFGTEEVPLIPEHQIVASLPASLTIGELLAEADTIARRLLFDVGAADAAALVRTWPSLVHAVTRMADQLPVRPASLPLRHQSLRLSAQADGASARANRRGEWPPAGPRHQQMSIMVEIFNRVRDLLGRYGPELSAAIPSLGQQTVAARVDALRSLGYATHAVLVSLHERARRDPSPTASTSDPEATGVTVRSQRWLRTFEHSEALILGMCGAASYPAEVTGPITHGPDTERMTLAVTKWDVEVHRCLARGITPTDATLIARLESYLAAVAIRSVSFPPMADGQHPDAAWHHSLQELAGAWTSAANRWADLATALDPVDVDLLAATREMRGALRASTQVTDHRGHHNDPLTVAAEPFATAVLHVIASSGMVATAIVEAAAQPSLRGSARVLSRRANSDVDIDGTAEEQHTDAAWVSPRAIALRERVPIPAPVSRRLATACQKVEQQAQALSMAITTAVMETGRAAPPSLVGQRVAQWIDPAPYTGPVVAR